MTETTQSILWLQFGASIDMLENAIVACPDEAWGDQISFFEYWYYAYHALFWTDFYLSGKTPENFAPPAPFTKGEFEADELPESVYGKAELLTYLEHVRSSLRTRVAGLTEEDMKDRFQVGKKEYSVLEWLLYNMRHVQHHTAQLNLLLRQSGLTPPNWISRTKHPLEG
jgi:DinB superfamily